MTYLYALNRPIIPAPKGENEIYQLYGFPGSYKTPQEYWREVGVFAFVNREAFAHIPFLRDHGGFWTNRGCRDAMEAAFETVVVRGLAKEIHSFDGCFNYRLVRGGSKLSLHSFGAAVDLNAVEMPLGSSKQFSTEFVKCFTELNFTWGGNYKQRKDPQHFSFGEY